MLCKQITLAVLAGVATTNMVADDFVRQHKKLAAQPTIEAFGKLTQNSENPTKSPVNKEAEIKELIATAKQAQHTSDSQKAIQYYTKVLNLDPENFQAHINLASICYNNEKPQEATEHYKTALKNNPDSHQIRYNIGLCLKSLGEFEQALELFSEAFELAPDYIKAQYQIAEILKKLGKTDQAKAVFIDILEENPSDASAHKLLAGVYKESDQHEMAIQHLKTASRLRPRDIYTMLELANLMTMCGETDEALGLYHKAEVLYPEIMASIYNTAYILKRDGYVPEAVELLRKVLDKKPEHTQAHICLSLALLSLGKFNEGWKEYEWRWETTKGRIPRLYHKPVWDGSDLTNKKILVIAEQGLGDTFQFIRYAKILKDMGGYVIFRSRPSQIDILKECDYIDEVISQDAPVKENFDCHITLMSIPLVLKTQEKTIPNIIPYLNAKPELIEYWANKLSKDPNFKIGICWQGNANYSTEFLRKTVAAKSMHVKLFEPLSKIPGISLYSLQKVFGTEQLNELNGTMIVHDFGPDLDTTNGRFMDTAAIIKNLDLIITVDTSLSHLAAALGAPTWILLPTPADWRWMLKRTDTPWYPQVRLFRQPIHGDWENTIRTVEDELRKMLNCPKPKRTPHINLSIEETKQEIESNNNIKNIENQSQPLDECLDKVSILALKTDAPGYEVQEALNLYNKKMNEYPQTKLLSQQLLFVNKYLKELSNQLKTIDHDVFNDKFSKITFKIAKANEFKNAIKEEIRTSQNT